MACSRHVLASWIVLSAIFAQISTQLYSGTNSQIIWLSLLKKGLCSPVRDDSNSSHRQPWHPSASPPTATSTPRKGWVGAPGLQGQHGWDLCPPHHWPGRIFMLSLSRFPQWPASTFSPHAWEKTWVVATGSQSALRARNGLVSYFETTCLGLVSNWTRQEKPEALFWARLKY